MHQSADLTNPLEDHADASMSNLMTYDGHSTEDDDDGGVAIPPNITDTFHNPHSTNADNEDIDMIDAQSTAVDASSISTPAQQSEVTVTATSDPPAYASLENPDVPTAILLHQLEQIQEAQTNNSGMGLTGHVGSSHFNNSNIPPTLIYPPSFLGLGDGDVHMEETMASSSDGLVSIGAQAAPTAAANAQQHSLFLDMDTIDAAGIDFAVGETTFMSSADMEFIEQVDGLANHSALKVFEFLWNWGHRSQGYPGIRKKEKGPQLSSLNRQRRNAPKQIRRCDLQGDKCDFQGMDWVDMDVTRQEARDARHMSYENYQSIRSRPPYRFTMKSRPPPAPPNSDNFLKFRRMDLKHRPHSSHFQLRNLVACTSRSNVFYAGKNKVHYSNPLTGRSRTVMDLTDSDIQPFAFQQIYGGVQLSTIAAKHDILLAGGFNGEYAMINLNSTLDSGHVEGLITEHPNSITNHISLSTSRSSGLPQAAFSSNDAGLRVLDCITNTFTASYTYPFAINCTAISPDSRLRMVVGDSTFVHVCDAETGQTLQKLGSHRDYGFACAWADNGWHVATGNQDMTVKVWDARMWTDRNGAANPLKSIGSELAGVRSLQFSPLGSGKRILLACEATDFVDVIDAESFDSKQTLDFFGELGGACFTPDGQDVFVANCDEERGGIIELERTGEGARIDYDYGIENNNVDRINREITRRENKAWLDNEVGLFGAQHHQTRRADRDTSDLEDLYQVRRSKFIDALYSQDTCELDEFEREQQLTYELSNKTSYGNQAQQFFSSSVTERSQTARGFQPRYPGDYWETDDSEILGDGYTSIHERMIQQARGYDWSQDDRELVANSRSNNRTLSWHRRKHLFEGSTSVSIEDIGL